MVDMSYCIDMAGTGFRTLEILLSDQGYAQHRRLSCLVTLLRHRAAHKGTALHIFIFPVLLLFIGRADFLWFRSADEIGCMDGRWLLRILLLMKFIEHSVLISDNKL